MKSQSSCVETLPCLKGGLVRLREVRVEDAAAFTELFKLDAVSQFLSPPPANVEEFTAWIELCRSRHVEGRAACYTVFTHDSDDVAGVFMCVRADNTEPQAEIGFALAPRVWGTGVFRDAAEVYIDYLFTHWKLSSLVGRTLARNHRGLGAMRKLHATIVEQTIRDNGEAEFVWQIKSSDFRS